MPIPAYDGAIFCAAILNMVEKVDFSVLRMCFNAAKKHLFTDGKRQAFFNDFIENYKKIETNTYRLQEVANSVAL